MFARPRHRSVFVPRDGYILELPKITFLIIIKIVQFACQNRADHEYTVEQVYEFDLFISLVHYHEVCQELASAVFSSSGLMN